MKKTIIGLFITVIILTGLVLRLGPVLEQRDYWYDEAFTGILLRQPWGEMNQMIFDDVHPPLYYWLVKPWASVFGYTSFGIRSFSTFMGILTIFSVYWIGKRMFNERSGLLAAVITAVSPFAIQYSQEARMYSLFGLLMIWATWFFYRALKHNEWRDWALWGIFGGLSFCTHYLSVFFFVIFFLTAVFYEYIFSKRSLLKALLIGKQFWKGVGVIAIFFVAWLPYFIPHMMKGNLGWIGVSYLSDVPKALQIFLFGHPLGAGGVPDANSFKYFFDESSAGLLVLVIMIIWSVAAWKKKIKREEFFILGALSLGTLVFMIVLSHFNLKLYVSRYFMPAAIMIYLLLAGMTVIMFKKVWVWLAVAAVFVFLILTLKPITYNSQWYRVSQLVKSGVIESDYTITTSPFDYTTMRYYISQERLKYHHKANPREDFSGWVVVGNENRLQTIEEIKALKSYIIIDRTCNWEGLELKEINSFGELKVCQEI
ncbi:MAG: glycosyltransferase family 39 protein [Candidatus Moranbacteria bacterium]|nr:glycosyltransferase family 39 protein [Candidatus Moranbacteria bacterium]